MQRVVDPSGGLFQYTGRLFALQSIQSGPEKSSDHFPLSLSVIFLCNPASLVFCRLQNLSYSIGKCTDSFRDEIEESMA